MIFQDSLYYLSIGLKQRPQQHLISQILKLIKASKRKPLNQKQQLTTIQQIQQKSPFIPSQTQPQATSFNQLIKTISKINQNTTSSTLVQSTQFQFDSTLQTQKSQVPKPIFLIKNGSEPLSQKMTYINYKILNFMNKNKSQSVSLKPTSVKNTASLSLKQKTKRNESKIIQKPSIDLDIAKDLDTLDRQGIINLKKSLKASKQWNELQNQVEQEIVYQDGNDIEQHLSNKKKIKNNLQDQIKEEIVQYPDQESPNKFQQNKTKIERNQKKIIYEQGRTKTYIKPRPISAVQKQEVAENRSSQIIKNTYQNPSLSFRQNKNPFKKSESVSKKEQNQKVSSILKRIKHLDHSKIEQLQIILEKLQKGEIQSVQASSEVIKMNNFQMDNPLKQKQKQNVKLIEFRQSMPTINLQQPIDVLQECDQVKSGIIQNKTKTQSINNLITESEPKSQNYQKIDPKVPKQSLVLPNSSFKQAINKEPKILMRKTNIFAIKIISNWGHAKTIGLTKIQLFSKNGQFIEVQQNQIKNCSKRMLKLFSGNPFTTNQNQMWISPCPQPPSLIIIEISLNVPVGAVRIWNYNKSLLQSTKGTKNVKLIMNDEKWSGQIKKGSGNDHQDYSTLIKFSMNPNATIPDVIIPVHQKPLQSLSIPLIQKDPPGNKWLQQTLMKKQLMQLNQGARDKQKVVQNKIQRSDSLQIRKSGAKSSMDNRTSSKIQKRQVLNQDCEQKKYLETEAQSVKKDVAQSLQKIRMNLQFGQDIISKDLQNKKSSAFQKRKNSSKIQKPIISEQLSAQRQSLSSIKDNKKSKLENIPDFLKNNYASNIPLNKHQKLQKQSPIITYAVEQNHPDPSQKINQQSYFNSNKLEVKEMEDRVTIVKPAPIKNVSSILNLKQEDDLGAFIKQLNEIIPSTSPTKIPELPKGTKLTFTLLSNYGDPYYVGLSKIQIFDKNGNVLDIGLGQISGNCQEHPISNIINSNIKVYDKNSLWLTELRKSNKVSINLQFQETISLIRIWNYNQSRIHSNRGVKLISIELDGNKIFQGQIGKSKAEYNYSDCQYLLFTEDNKIINNIIQKDWLTNNKDQLLENELKNTISNFARPTTSEYQEIKTKENRQANAPSNIKKFKNAYQTPILPKGKCLEILLISTWGDRHYVGLNKLQIFDNNKNNLLSKPTFKISALPSSISTLPGMAKDPRTVDKLVSKDSSAMWLSPMNSDLQRLENNINSITIRFDASQTIGMINFWNYSKTVSRGVKEIMVLLDDIVLYQGYVANNEEKEYTSIAFTKDIGYLQQLKYQGYNQDSLGQNVGLVNEKKQLKGNSSHCYAELQRPFTSILGK